MKHRMITCFLIVLLLIASSCRAVEDEERVAELEEENEQLRERIGELETQIASMLEDDGEQPRAWTPEGLLHQPEMEPLRILGEEYGFSPGTTEWRDFDPDLYAEFTEPGQRGEDTPAELLVSLVRELPLTVSLGRDLWEVTLRIMSQDDEAVGVIMFWGLKDDATAGIDYRVTMENDGGTWYVSLVQERYHCRRGVCEVEQICQ